MPPHLKKIMANAALREAKERTAEVIISFTN